MRYAIVIEQADGNYSAYAPILAGQGRRRSAGAHYLDRGTGYLVLEPSAYDGLR
jgi:hypothetical protein